MVDHCTATLIVGLALMLVCSSALGTPVEKTKYGAAGLRVECRPDPLHFRDNPDTARMEKAFGEAGVQARWVSVVDPLGSPVYASSFIPTSLDKLDEREKAMKMWVNEIHKQGMAAMSWYPLILCKSGKAARPDWEQVPIVPNPPGVHRESNCCFNTGYGDALIGFCSEAIDKFGLDGIWFDGSAWTQIWDRPVGLTCACSACKALFRKQTGLDIPTKIDWNDAVFRKWVAWRFESFSDYIRRLAAGIRKRHPNAAVVINHYHRPGIPWHSAIPLNPYDADIISGSEASGERGADLVSRLCRAYGRAQSEVWMPFEFGPDPDTSPKTDLSIHHALTCITAGAMPSYGMGVDAENAPATARRVAAIINSLKPYVSHRSLKYAAIHVSQQTETFWFGRSPRGQDWAPEPYWQCITGWMQGLMETHIPPDVVYDKQLTDNYLKDYKLLFMPLSFALSDEQCGVIERFARRGGTVVLGPAAGELDEWGEKRSANPLGRALGFAFDKVPQSNGTGAALITLRGAAVGCKRTVTPFFSVPDLGDRAWERLAEGEYPGMSAPAIARRRLGGGSVVLIGADLAGSAGWGTPVVGGDTSIAVTDETAFSGTHSLKFVDGPKADQEFYPDLEIKYPPTRAPEAAELILSCALRAESGAVPRIEMRAWPDHIGPSLKLDQDGKLWAVGKPLCDIPRGQWFRLKLLARLTGDKTFDVTVSIPGRSDQVFAGLAYPSATFEGSDWMVIYGDGPRTGAFYVDDLVLDWTAPGPKPARMGILRDDFEDTPVGDTVPRNPIPGVVNSIVDAAAQPVSLLGPGSIRMGVFRGFGSDIIVHLHNTAGSRTRPASGDSMTLKAPGVVRSAKLVLSGKELAVTRSGGRSLIEVPPVALHEVVLLKQ